MEPKFPYYIAPVDDPEANGHYSFGAVIEYLRQDPMKGKARRAGWNGKGMWIALMDSLSLPPFNTQDAKQKVSDRTAGLIGPDVPLESQPYFVMWTADQKWQPGWLASQADMLATDWELL